MCELYLYTYPVSPIAFYFQTSPIMFDISVHSKVKSHTPDFTKPLSIQSLPRRSLFGNTNPQLNLQPHFLKRKENKNQY